MFKILLNNTLLWRAIPYVQDILDPKNSTRRSSLMSRSTMYTDYDSDDNNDIDGGVEALYRRKLYKYTVRDLSFLSFTIFLNNLIFPAIAILIVSSDCFYNALFQPPDVDSYYDYTVCSRYGALDKFTCYQFVTSIVTSSYTPPFIYSFQCASRIVINYAAVYILMFTFEGFIQPAYKLTVKFIYDRVMARLRVHSGKASSQHLHALEKAIKEQQQEEEDEEKARRKEELSQSEGGGTSLSSDANKDQRDDSSAVAPSLTVSPFHSDPSILSVDDQIPQILSTKHKPGVSMSYRTNQTSGHFRRRIPWYYRYLFSTLPYNLQNLVPEPSYEVRSALLLFDKNRLVVRLNAYLAVFMSFGVLFPPLAIITCISAFSLTVYEETIIGRLYYDSEKLNYHWYKKQIDRNCSGISNSLKYSLWTLVPVSCCLYCYLIFDTWGDQEGWAPALPPTIIMFGLPILFLLAYSRRRSFFTILEAIFFQNITCYRRNQANNDDDESIRSRTISGDSSVNGSKFGRLAMNFFRKFSSESHPNNQRTAGTTTTATRRKTDPNDSELESEKDSSFVYENHLRPDSTRSSSSRPDSSRLTRKVTFSFSTPFGGLAGNPAFRPYDSDSDDNNEEGGLDDNHGLERETSQASSSRPSSAVEIEMRPSSILKHSNLRNSKRDSQPSDAV
eukprot:gene14417-15958_t